MSEERRSGIGFIWKPVEEEPVKEGRRLKKKKTVDGRIQGCTPVIPALGRYRQDDQKFRVTLGYIMQFNTNTNLGSMKLYP